jgi:hypothetical protein
MSNDHVHPIFRQILQDVLLPQEIEKTKMSDKDDLINTLYQIARPVRLDEFPNPYDDNLKEDDSELPSDGTAPASNQTEGN